MLTPSEPGGSGANVTDLLRTAAARTPGLLAIDDAGQQTTYGDLDADVDRLANYLLARLPAGPQPERPCIGLRITGATTLVIASLGCARAGMIAVPIDPSYPQLRLEQLLQDTGAALVLTDDAGPAPSERCDFVLVSTGVREGSAVPRASIGGGQDPTTIRYTSGSTGIPKGVVIPHDARLAIADLLGEMGFTRNHTRIGMICVGSLPQAESLLTNAVLGGATLVPFDIRKRDFTDLADWLITERITAFACVPTLFRHLVSTLPPGRGFPELARLAMFGESMQWSDVAQARSLLAEGATVYNAYASTESGLATLATIGPEQPIGEGRVPAGHVVTGYEVFILDAAGDARTDGAQGEIAVAGRGLPLGYWRRPDLTAATWVTRPDGSRYVRTGDIGRLLPDGTLEHLGRLDHVVKIAGNRVDLGEVEAAIAPMPEVASVAVAARPDPVGDLRLVAYVAARPGERPDHFVIRHRLSRRLPGFMLPDQVVVLEELPRLPNGKVDRGALAERPTTNPSQGAAGERGGAGSGEATERAIARLAAGILGLDQVGPDDDFYALGGDSLRAAQLLAEIHQTLHVDLAPSAMVHASTAAALASLVRAGGGDELTPLVPIRVRGSRSPVYFVHHGFGSVTYARELADHLDDEQPVYGLLPLTAGDVRQAYGSVSQAAASYLDAIRHTRPHGPYALYGQSLGGTIAYEMALQLEAAGESVSFLGLGDSTAPWTVTGYRLPSEPVLAQVRKRLTEAARMGPVAAARHLTGIARGKLQRVAAPRTMRRSVKRFDTRLAGGQVSNQDRLDHAMRLLLMDYVSWRGRPLHVTPIMFRAEDGDRAPVAGWLEVAPDLEVVDVPGDHWNMTDPPRSAKLARAVADALDRS